MTPGGVPAPAADEGRGARAVGLLGTLLTAAAALFDAEPLYVPGLLFVLLAAGAHAWVWLAVRGLEVERTLGAPLVEEDQPLDVRLTVRGAHGVLTAGRLSDPLLATAAALNAARRQTALQFTTSFDRRGRIVLDPPSVTVRDPFGLTARTAVGRYAHEVLVLPAVGAVTLMTDGGGGDVLGDRAACSGFAAEVELDGLRPHRPGASASRISWATYARAGELMERHLQPEGDSRPCVVLDPRLAPGQEEAALDAAVRATASLCVYLARRGGCSLVLPGDRRPTPVDGTLAAWPRLHVRLALLRATSPAAPPPAVPTGRRGTIVYVTAQRLKRPPRALTQVRGAGQVLVLPGTLEGRAAGFTVSGCTGYDLTGAVPGRAAGRTVLR